MREDFLNYMKNSLLATRLKEEIIILDCGINYHARRVEELDVKFNIKPVDELSANTQEKHLAEWKKLAMEKNELETKLRNVQLELLKFEKKCLTED